MLDSTFFARDAQQVAQDLLGKVLQVKYQNRWLCARIIETEAYYLQDKASHASLGYTEKRKALFMPAGTIYMYYARGGDSLNLSCQGEGNAVLIKSGFPFEEVDDFAKMVKTMQSLNPTVGGETRSVSKLCSGQTLLCKSLGLKVKEWDQKSFDKNRFYIKDMGYYPATILTAKRLGIPPGRDEHLLYRFVDAEYVKFCTKRIRSLD